jgi:hypothetical protein
LGGRLESLRVSGRVSNGSTPFMQQADKMSQFRKRSIGRCARCNAKPVGRCAQVLSSRLQALTVGVIGTKGE